MTDSELASFGFPVDEFKVVELRDALVPDFFWFVPIPPPPHAQPTHR
jgi:hypothetical protein